MGDKGFKSITMLMSQQLEQEATIEEVKQVVWDCDGSKVPGPDGFTLAFYKNAWHHRHGRTAAGE